MRRAFSSSRIVASRSLLSRIQVSRSVTVSARNSERATA
jgi:hypothetical protein